MKIGESLKRREFLGLASMAAVAAPLSASPLSAPTTPQAHDAVRVYSRTPVPHITSSDARFARAVRDLLTNDLRGLGGGAIAPCVRSRLANAFGGRLTSTAMPPHWVYVWIVDHWEMVCSDSYSFEVRLNNVQSTIVEVDAIEPMG